MRLDVATSKQLDDVKKELGCKFVFLAERIDKLNQKIQDMQRILENDNWVDKCFGL